MKHWYAVQCKPNQDARAAEQLALQRYTVFRPLAKVRRRTASGGFRSRVESLFPRYLFIEIDPEVESVAPIRSTRGVQGLVRDRSNRPLEVPDTLIAAVKERVGESGCVDLAAEEALRPNEAVVVVEGIFEGFEGVFEAKTGMERVVVLLSILGAHRRVELSESAVQKSHN